MSPTVHRFTTIAAVAVAAVALSAGGAVAGAKITGAQIKDGTITSADVKDRSLLAKDFKPKTLPAGPRGPAGQPGSQGVFGVGLLTGQIANQPASQTSFGFVGQTINFAVEQNQAIEASVTGVLGTTSTTAGVDYAVCTQRVGDPNTFDLMSTYQSVSIPTGRTSIAAAGVKVPASPGNYTVGLCLRNSGANPLNNNDFVSGFARVVNVSF